VASPRRFQTNGEVGDEVYKRVLAAVEKLFPSEISSHVDDPAGDPFDPDYIKARVHDTESGLGRTVSDADVDYWVGVITAHEGWSDYWRVRVIMGDTYMMLTDEQIDGMKRRVAGIAYVATMFSLGKAAENRPTSRKGSGQGSGSTIRMAVTDDDIAFFNQMYDQMFPRNTY
jgi:hypothetical protein